MIGIKTKIMALIALIPIAFVLGSANAASISTKSSDTQHHEATAKATVLAKGQNNLPKHERTDCPA